MSFTTELTDELNLLMQFNLKNEQDGIKIHHEASTDTIAAAGRLYNKGLITAPKNHIKSIISWFFTLSVDNYSKLQLESRRGGYPRFRD